MKLTCAILLSLAAFAAQSHAAIVITEVMSSSAHAGGTNNGDWFEITNTGVTAVDITGWGWEDDTFTTPGVPAGNFGGVTSIAAGQSYIFSEETVGGESTTWTTGWGLTGGAYRNLGSTVFQGLGALDSVRIYDATNTLVASVTLPTAVAGRSFEWDTNGNYLGTATLSNSYDFQSLSNGQNTGLGAGVDIGSPGVAVVPEPSSLVLLGLGAMSIVGLRRRRK